MEDYKIFTEFDINIQVKQVLTYLECAKSNPMYEDLRQECRRLEPEFQQLVRPEAVCVFDTFIEPAAESEEEVAAVYVLFHIGAAISEAIEEAFQADRYMEGMMLDAMADDYLFQMGEQIEQRIHAICRERGCGIRRRLEAPVDIPASSQREILNRVQAATDISVELTEGFMFRPVKTLAYVLLLTSDTQAAVPFHDCGSCGKADCSHRRQPAQLEVLWQGQAAYISLDNETEKKSIHELLLAHGFPVDGTCGGNGLCKKCRIRLDYGELAITVEDRLAFSEAELEAGWRLACRAYLTLEQRTCTIELYDSSEEVQAAVARTESGGTEAASKGLFKIAIDIGTTTLALALLNEEGQVVATHVQLNHQRAYGADVIARQRAAAGGKAADLQQQIAADLRDGIRQLQQQQELLLCEGGGSDAGIDYIVMAGNTTMIHLLMGYSCEGLGKYPYHTVNLDWIHTSLPELTGSGPDIPVMILPGISAYVGGDIVAGMLVCELERQEKPVLLLDIGTNGEMALGTRERLLVTSAAAGPAFEGGNISCGMAAVNGAVSRVRIEGDEVITEVIGGGTAAGICGTGVMGAVAEMRRHGIIGADGLMKEPYFSEGFCFGYDAAGKKLSLTQKDIREFQMAKGAIRAGVEVLLEAYGSGYEDLEAVYLAGGFGVYMDVDEAICIGLFPASVRDKIMIKGNTSLAGACQAAEDPGVPGRTKRLIRAAEEIHLSESEQFQELYMKHMYLDERIE